MYPLLRHFPLEPDALHAIVAALGVLTQMAGALLLNILFIALRSYAARRPYFRAWGAAWCALTVALIAVLSLYGRENGVAALLGAPFIRVVYQVMKLVYVSFLAAGVAGYVGGYPVNRALRRALPVAVAYGVVTALLAPTMNAAVALQAPLVAAVFAGCAWGLLRLPRARASLGSRATGLVFAAMALVWVGYGFAFPLFAAQEQPLLRGVLTALVRHNSYIDLLLQMLLGYGMVVLLMEDARREVALAHAQVERSYLQLKRTAEHDPLTGAYNRLAFAEGEGLPDAGVPGAALLADLDNLKVVNDTLGHAAGDDLLDRAAAALRAAARPEGALFRWGGDEFLLVVPGAGAEALRHRVAREAARMVTPSAAPLLFSVGAAEFGEAVSLDAAIREADAAMYRDKAARRSARISAQPVNPLA